ncbi:hypothetical protein GTQ43_10740 [Nostoc sp. KVJ3]|uniref:hypothetical protein n=1 Tax=Nostoc sp. KVJ3 TaxID=457945 RepID=UPI002237A481|nr:hypothetical protein [Nostoc sp. KVJ3]MCW5314263.1 hypothetical protein [Nostoc sp. KVJ3]
MQTWDRTKLPKLFLFGVKDAARLSPKQKIILSRATWYDLGELKQGKINSNLDKG